MTTNIQQGFNDLVLAGAIILAFFFVILITKMLWKLIDHIAFKIKIKRSIKRDKTIVLGNVKRKI